MPAQTRCVAAQFTQPIGTKEDLRGSGEFKEHGVILSDSGAGKGTIDESMNEGELLHFLDMHQIPYFRIEHSPVMTCEEADRVRPDMPGAHLKNLFLRDENSSHYFLVATLCEQRVDTKALGRMLGVRKLHFGSAEEMQELLGLSPGAVSILGLAQDKTGRVRLVMDEAIWQEVAFLCHPLVNTATLILQRADLLRFLELTGHPAQVIAIPSREG
jgi:Ala-tRNA(Pro) deacylase